MPRLGRGRRLIRWIRAPLWPHRPGGRITIRPDLRTYQFVGRLGRSRRRKQLLRAPSTTTATPLVRRGFIVIRKDLRPHYWAARIGRTRRDRHGLKAPSVTTPTPLVRNRVLERLSRPRLAFFKRHPARLSKPQRPTLEPGKQPLVKPDRPRFALFKRHPARLARPAWLSTPQFRTQQPKLARQKHRYLHHQAKTVRAPSVPTATPLIRNRTIVHQRNRAARQRIIHHQARIAYSQARGGPQVVVPLRSLIGWGL